MRFFKPNLRSSIHAILSLGHPSVPPETMEMEIDIEDIRRAMLDLMTDVEDARFPQVLRRIRYAPDVPGLWFLRGDLMAALASSHGEAVAREKLETLSEMFEDLLPDGLRSRPSPLSSSFRNSEGSPLARADGTPDSGFKPSS
ncbi:hypothetical protein [Caenimonas soli]|uniref:hypothetical protein n=1 Tax=Caenimonas soli TaxID=2735555 RepID=UPI001A9BED28|nr:hypothetical protein [Caenimonas soli]